jgi:putative membrane protein
MSPKLVVAFAAVLAFPAVAMAETRLSDADQATLQHHHGVNMMEIEMGKLAQARGSEPVKKYASALVKDHQKADKEALSLARAHGIVLAEHNDEAGHAEMMKTMDRLSTLSGNDFDQAYLVAMIDGHTAEVGKLTVAIGKTSDVKLKVHLTKVKPVVERHAEQARALLTPAPAK